MTVEKQLDADQAWAYLQSKSVPNLDIERVGLHKITLVELLMEYRCELLQTLASATRKVLSPNIVQEIIDCGDPLSAFMRELRKPKV